MIQIALAYGYFEPVRAAIETCQHLVQAIPFGGSPLLQLPGVDNKLASTLQLRQKNPIRSIQGLLKLDQEERRKALGSLNDNTYSQAIHIAQQIPILAISNVHFKGA
jgi:translocation protein SEC63